MYFFRKTNFQKNQNENIPGIMCKLNVTEMKSAAYVSVSLLCVGVCVFMRASAHVQAIQPDQPSASGVIKCDAASGN